MGSYGYNVLRRVHPCDRKQPRGTSRASSDCGGAIGGHVQQALRACFVIAPGGPPPPTCSRRGGPPRPHAAADQTSGYGRGGPSPKCSSWRASRRLRAWMEPQRLWAWRATTATCSRRGGPPRLWAWMEPQRLWAWRALAQVQQGGPPRPSAAYGRRCHMKASLGDGSFSAHSRIAQFPGHMISSNFSEAVQSVSIIKIRYHIPIKRGQSRRHPPP